MRVLVSGPHACGVAPRPLLITCARPLHSTLIVDAMMPAVGAKSEEVVRRFARCVAALPQVRAAFVTMDQLKPNALTLWTLLEDYDEAAELQMVEFERQIEQEVGAETPLRYRLLYLRGRSPAALIPSHAQLLKSA